MSFWSGTYQRRSPPLQGAVNDVSAGRKLQIILERLSPPGKDHGKDAWVRWMHGAIELPEVLRSTWIDADWWDSALPAVAEVVRLSLQYDDFPMAWRDVGGFTILVRLAFVALELVFGVLEANEASADFEDCRHDTLANCDLACAISYPSLETPPSGLPCCPLLAWTPSLPLPAILRNPTPG
ncbi:hypothetical protein CYMTET_36663 [Cymbomonas tetramitiformis]|uniref:Uncharacterized protein n=1 Tax=Cymbomonas tetramitiformis TaxID=36881 RepID=A0AAE0CHW2_9CHLO|nr:hypothetical protein CYMTET_36663 [Cymbomonas tetramitiformis]